MSKVTLSICIPTHNRKNKLCTIVKQLLSINDQRFIITISDNKSTDGTIIELKTINDNRLKIYSSPIILPAYHNYNVALQKGDAEYVLLLLDKEHINPEYLSDFIDFLESEKPLFGIIDIFNNPQTSRFIKNEHGINSIMRGGGKGDTHPSGFFYRKDLYQKEFDRMTESIKDGGLWTLDIISAGLGAQYDSYLYCKPLISYDNSSILEGESKTAYSTQTIYWYGGMRVDTLMLFVHSLLNLHFDNKEEIIHAILKKHVIMMTSTQKRYFSEPIRCHHYGLKTRRVSLCEMIYWVFAMVFRFIKECRCKISIKYANCIYTILCGIKTAIYIEYPSVARCIKSIKTNKQ